jgi:hypothetical protein
MPEKQRAIVGETWRDLVLHRLVIAGYVDLWLIEEDK